MDGIRVAKGDASGDAGAIAEGNEIRDGPGVGESK
jgi:hypothetical protein